MSSAERTVAQKLSALLKLQSIDTKIDEIRKMRGDLPAEVQDLEDEVIGYQTRVSKHESEIQVTDDEISTLKERKKEAEKMIAKYREQQMNVRNNREFEAISKEIESEELEMTLCDKKIRTAQEKITQKEGEVKRTQEAMQEREKDLKNKKVELDNLLVESNEEENKLIKEREKQTKNIEDRLLRSYEKIRSNAGNGLAVVMVRRDACGGCFNVVPPQRQAEVREKKKLIVCEHCGRILAGVEEAKVPVVEEKEKPTRASKKDKDAAPVQE